MREIKPFPSRKIKPPKICKFCEGDFNPLRPYSMRTFCSRDCKDLYDLRFKYKLKPRKRTGNYCRKCRRVIPVLRRFCDKCRKHFQPVYNKEW